MSLRVIEAQKMDNNIIKTFDLIPENIEKIIVRFLPQKTVKKIHPEIARKLLKGSGKNERLNERLLKYRAEDIINNGR